MFHRLCLALVLISWILPSSIYAGVLGSVILKDGSILHGDIVKMVEGTLKVESAFGAGEPFLITWVEVDTLATSQPVIFVLGDGASLTGIAEKGNPGELQLTVDSLPGRIPIQLASITAINPPEVKAVKYTANINFGGKVTSGNTKNRQANLLGGFTARSERLRLILDARYFYAEEDKSVTDRNAFGTMDLNFFMTKRSYLFLAVLMEQDTFDDLQLRTAVTGGPGYQFIEKGDFANPYFRDMTLQADIGAGFWNEDRKIDDDDNHGVYRWSVRWEWDVLPKVTIFHQHMGFPESSDVSNYYINSLQGIRFNIWERFNASVQINYKYDNKPAENSGKSDTKAIFSVGYEYEN